MTAIGDRIGRLCVLLGKDGDYLRSAAERAGAAETLARILTTVRGTDQPGDELLCHDLDTLDEAMARTGHGYLTRADRVYRHLPGQPPPPAVKAWYVLRRMPVLVWSVSGTRPTWFARSPVGL